MEEEAVTPNSVRSWIESFLDHLKVERAASTNTVVSYQNDLGLCESFLKSHSVVDLAAIDGLLLGKLESVLAAGVAKSTAQRRLSALRSFLKYLSRNGLNLEADLPSTGGFRNSRRLPKALNVQKLDAVLNQAEIVKPEGLRDRALFELIYGAGLRISEAVDLEVGSVDLAGYSVRILGKRGKTRLNPLPEGTVDWLQRYLEMGRAKLVTDPIRFFIVSNHGKRLLRQTAYNLLARYRKQAGLAEAVGPHTLRHSFAVDMLKSGSDLRVVQELLGHESIATTQIYTQLDLAEVRKRYDRAHPRR